MNKDNKLLKNNELDGVSGGIASELTAPEIKDSCFERSSVESVISPNFPSPEIDADNENSLARPVGLFPGLSALP